MKYRVVIETRAVRDLDEASGWIAESYVNAAVGPQPTVEIRFKWCSGRDSNPYALRHTPLKRVCLPIPPPEHLYRGEGLIRDNRPRLSSPEIGF